MTVKIRPLYDRLIVERIEDTEQMVGGIIIPDTAKEKPQQGKVLAVGKGKMQDGGLVTPLDVKAGDTVLFGKYSGQEITESSPFLVETIHGARLFKQLSSSVHSSSWSRSSALA